LRARLFQRQWALTQDEMLTKEFVIILGQLSWTFEYKSGGLREEEIGFKAYMYHDYTVGKSQLIFLSLVGNFFLILSGV